MNGDDVTDSKNDGFVNKNVRFVFMFCMCQKLIFIFAAEFIFSVDFLININWNFEEKNFLVSSIVIK